MFIKYHPEKSQSAHLISLVQRMRAAQDEQSKSPSVKGLVKVRYLQRKVDQFVVSLQDLN